MLIKNRLSTISMSENHGDQQHIHATRVPCTVHADLSLLLSITYPGSGFSVSWVFNPFLSDEYRVIELLVANAVKVYELKIREFLFLVL